MIPETDEAFEVEGASRLILDGRQKQPHHAKVIEIVFPKARRQPLP
jgi:hypothetical protein